MTKQKQQKEPSPRPPATHGISTERRYMGRDARLRIRVRRLDKMTGYRGMDVVSIVTNRVTSCETARRTSNVGTVTVTDTSQSTVIGVDGVVDGDTLHQNASTVFRNKNMRHTRKVRRVGNPLIP